MSLPNDFHPLACRCVHCTKDETAPTRCTWCGVEIDRGVLCWDCTDKLFEEVRNDSSAPGQSPGPTNAEA